MEVEVWRFDEGLVKWRSGGLEVWKFGEGVATWRHRVLEFWTAEEHYRCVRCGGMELRSS